MTNRFFFTGAQCRAARALLGWTQQELADVTNISIPTIRNFESEKGISPGYQTSMFLTLRNYGIQFVRTDEHLGVLLNETRNKELQKS